MTAGRLARLAAAVLSAVLLWAAFPPCGETAGLAVALTPLLAVSRLCAVRRAAAAWTLGGFLFWAATLSWMPAIVKNGGPWPLVVLGWLGLAGLCTAYFALYGALSARYWSAVRPLGGRKGAALTLLGLVVVEPSLWAGVEWLRGTLFTGFAWNFLGTGLAHVPAFARPARLGGVYLVSALVVLLNGVFATLVCRIVSQMVRAAPAVRPRLLRSLETALPLAAVMAVYWLASPAVTPPASAAGAARPPVALRVALVQRNLPCVFSDRSGRDDPSAVYGRLLAPAAAARPHLVVWGESAMAEFGTLRSAAARAAAQRFCEQAGGASLLAGGDDVETGPDGTRKVFNAAGLYSPSAPPARPSPALAVYAKQHLVPFGEYIPFDKLVPALQRLSPIGVSLWPGDAKVLDLPVGADVVKIAPLICFEDTDPALARAAAKRGAQAIVLITNDSWFSHSQEPLQHAWQAVLRAVETGLPVIRVGNSGVTGVISPDGKARWLGGERPAVDVQGTMTTSVEIPAGGVLTPYVRYGNLLLLVLFASSLLGVFLVEYAHDKR
ncbi:MAG: apolipoprotein N-acyltransferase [Kiritimatiellia bacterium]